MRENGVFLLSRSSQEKPETRERRGLRIKLEQIFGLLSKKKKS